MARVRVEVPVEEKPAPIDQPMSHAAHNSAGGKPTKRHSNNKLVIIVLIIAGAIFVANLINDRNRLQQQLNDTKGEISGSQQVKDIVNRLASSVELPSDETPQMRTIEDAAKFTEQNPSLGDIKNGDVLLFFEKSKKVVVYRPSTKKAIVVVTLAEPAAAQPQSDNTGQNR